MNAAAVRTNGLGDGRISAASENRLAPSTLTSASRPCSLCQQYCEAVLRQHERPASSASVASVDGGSNLVVRRGRQWPLLPAPGRGGSGDTPERYDHGIAVDLPNKSCRIFITTRSTSGLASARVPSRYARRLSYTTGHPSYTADQARPTPFRSRLHSILLAGDDRGGGIDVSKPTDNRRHPAPRGTHSTNSMAA